MWELKGKKRKATLLGMLNAKLLWCGDYKQNKEEERSSTSLSFCALQLVSCFFFLAILTFSSIRSVYRIYNLDLLQIAPLFHTFWTPLLPASTAHNSFFFFLQQKKKRSTLTGITCVRWSLLVAPKTRARAHIHTITLAGQRPTAFEQSGEWLLLT